jgi:hypothetical protein
VSRDGDYGTKLSQQTILNDWLRLEFKERVSRQRKIELTDRLSNALKKLEVSITNEDLAEENRLLEETSDLSEEWNRLLLNRLSLRPAPSKLRIFVPEIKPGSPPREDEDDG